MTPGVIDLPIFLIITATIHAMENLYIQPNNVFVIQPDDRPIILVALKKPSMILLGQFRYNDHQSITK